MKKITLLFSLVFAAVAFGQTGPANGSTAPNWTATDIYGNSYTLYNYLNSGKNILIEMGGTGCQPSWEYCKTQALADFYNAYGPQGSNEAMVFQIESPSATIAALNGTNTTSFGDVAGNTPYPIFRSPNLYNYYTTNGVPHFYRICPTKEVYHTFMFTAPGAVNYLNIWCQQMTGLQNFARVQKNDFEEGICGASDSFSFKLKNYGTNAITSAVINLKEDGITVSTKNFTGNLAQFASEVVKFDAVPVNPAATYTAQVQFINGSAMSNNNFGTVVLPFHKAVVTGRQIKVRIHTDNCAPKMSWQIKNSSGSYVYNSPAYGPVNSCSGGNNNAIINHNILLPNADDCYTFTLKDSGNLGWRNYGSDYWPDTTPGIEILYGGNIVYSNLNVGNFGTSLTLDHIISVNTTMGNEEFASNDIVIYPNPSTGTINIDTAEPVDLTLFDLMGKQVFYATGIDSNTTVNLSQVESGVYVAKMVNAEGRQTVKKLSITN